MQPFDNLLFNVTAELEGPSLFCTSFDALYISPVLHNNNNAVDATVAATEEPMPQINAIDRSLPAQ